jgi:hypothetical protein
VFGVLCFESTWSLRSLAFVSVSVIINMFDAIYYIVSDISILLLYVWTF